MYIDEDRVQAAIEKANRFASLIQEREERKFAEEQRAKEEAFKQYVSSSDFDIAKYWTKKSEYTSFFGIDEEKADNIAEKVGGYRPKYWRDTAVGLVQTFSKSPEEKLYQDKLRDLQLQGHGVPTSLIMEVKRKAIDREQRQFWGGIGAGLLDNWYKKDIAPVDKLVGDWRDFLPATTQEELEFGAGRVGAWTGAGVGLAASVYGTGALLKGVAGAGLVRDAVKAKALQEIVKRQAVAKLGDTALVRFSGDIVGAALETAAFDLMRKDENWLEHQLFSAGAVSGIYGLGLPGKAASALQNVANRRLGNELLDIASKKDVIPISQVDEILKATKVDLPEDIINKLPKADDRARIINAKADLIATETTMQPLAREAFEDLKLKDGYVFEGKKAIDYTFDDYLEEFNKIKTDKINSIVDETIKNISPDSTRFLQVELSPSIVNTKYENLRALVNNGVFDNMNLKEYIMLNTGRGFGNFNIKSLTPKAIREAFDSLDNLRINIEAGLIPNMKIEKAINEALKKQYSGIGLVKTRLNKLAEYTKDFVTPQEMQGLSEKLLDNGVNRFNFIKAGIDNVKENMVRRQELNRNLIDLAEKKRGLLDELKRIKEEYKLFNEDMQQKIKAINMMQAKTLRSFQRASIKLVAEEKNITKKSILMSIADTIANDAKKMPAKKFEQYRKLANTYIKEIETFFNEKAKMSIADLEAENITYHSTLRQNIYKENAERINELVQKMHVVDGKLAEVKKNIDMLKSTHRSLVDEAKILSKYDFAVVDALHNVTYTAQKYENKYIINMPGIGRYTLNGNLTTNEVLRDMAGKLNQHNGFLFGDKVISNNLKLTVYKYLQNMIDVTDKLNMPWVGRWLYDADIKISADKAAYKSQMLKMYDILASKENMESFLGTVRTKKDAFEKSSQRIFKALDGKMPVTELNPIEKQVHDTFENWLNDLAVKQRLTPEQIRKEYITHIITPEYREKIAREYYERYGNLSREQAMAQEGLGSGSSWWGGTDDTRSQSLLLDEINNQYLQARQSNTAPIIENAFYAFEQYMNDALPKIHYTPAMEKINQFLWLNRNHIPESVKEYLQGYLRDTVTKQGNRLNYRLNTVFNDTFRSVKEAINNMPLPDIVKKGVDKIAYSSNRLYDDVMTSILRWAYASKMAYNPTSPITNMFQKMLIYPFAGLDDIGRYSLPKYNLDSTERIVINDVDYGACKDILDKVPIARLRKEAGSFASAPALAGNYAEPVFKTAFDKVIDTGFVAFRWVDLDNIKTASLSGFANAIKRGESFEAALQYANYVAETTQFIYSRATRSAINRSPAKLLSTFSTWTMGYAQYWQELARVYGAEGVVRALGLQTFLPLLLSGATGYDFSRYTPTQIGADYITGRFDQFSRLWGMFPGANGNIVFIDKINKSMEGKENWLLPVLDVPQNKSYRTNKTLAQWVFGY